MPKTYTFHVSLPRTGRVWRKVELLANQTLEELHFAILDAFDFDSDHLYSFFMSGKVWDSTTEYRLPEGVDPWGQPYEDDDEEIEPVDLSTEAREANLRQLLGNDMTLDEMEAFMEAFWDDVLSEADEMLARDVRTTTLESLGLALNHTFLYLFDYGDEWRFKVRVHAINPDAPEADYPRLVENVGNAPEQYPDWEE